MHKNPFSQIDTKELKGKKASRLEKIVSTIYIFFNFITFKLILVLSFMLFSNPQTEMHVGSCVVMILSDVFFS